MDAPLFLTIVLDGVGIGAQPDAGAYGDAGSDTLAHVCAAARPALPHLARLGLGCIAPLPGVPPAAEPLAHYGRMQEVSAGKDSTTGHWELAGLLLEEPFPTYPDGFPPELVAAFLAHTGAEGALGGYPASGTAILDALGPQHQATGYPILYTSADSVFQIATHCDVVPLEALYRLCRVAREAVCVGPHAVGRVIARPFAGSPGAYHRLSDKRRDFSLRPPVPTLQEALQAHDVRTVALGKIGDLFGSVGFDVVEKTASNEDGVALTHAWLGRLAADEGRPAFVWVNLVDFDQNYGHRNDPAGFARALEAFDEALPSLLDALPPGAQLVITADHGNDPTTPSTDHSREYVPVLWYTGRPGQPLGTRATFADHAATVAAFFGVPWSGPGTAFSEQ